MKLSWSLKAGLKHQKSFSIREAHRCTEPPLIFRLTLVSDAGISTVSASEPVTDLDRLLGFIGPSPLPFWIRVSGLPLDF